LSRAGVSASIRRISFKLYFRYMLSSERSHVTGIALGLALASFAAYQQFKLPVVLPVLLASYGYDRTLAGGFMSIYALVGLLLSLRIGRLVERRGAIGPALFSLGLFAVAEILALVAPQFGLLVLLSRGLEGIAFAGLAISGPVLANANAAKRYLPVIAGFIAAWIPVGQLAATALAPVALATVGWQLLWFAGIAGSLAFMLWALHLRRDSTLANGGLRRAAAGGRSQHLSAKPEAADSSQDGLTRNQRHALVIVGGIFMLWSCQYFAYMTWLPQYLVEVHNFGASGAAVGYVVPVFLVMLFCILSGLAVRFGVSLRWLLVAALVCQSVVWLLVPRTDSGVSGLLSLIAYGISAGIVPTCLFSMPSAVLRRGHDTARAFGIVMTGRNIGVFIGPVLLAQVFQIFNSWDWIAPIFGAITILTLPLAIALAFKLRAQ